ncbi:hypothetical protein C0J52_02951 [Blattella germanica]|nr:hypothetical protein C0J52_02951 [Blattella germanica]
MKISLMEHGNGKMTDNFLRMVHRKHESELHTLKGQVESLALKFSAKDHECDTLQKQMREFNEKHEALLKEKSCIIDRLTAELAECRKNLHTGENEELKKKVDKLQAELESVRGDLKHYEEMAQLGLLGSEDSNSFNLNKKSNPSVDLNIKLRDELERCLAGSTSAGSLAMVHIFIPRVDRKLFFRVENEEGGNQETEGSARQSKRSDRQTQGARGSLCGAVQEPPDAANLMDQLQKYQTATNGGQTSKLQVFAPPDLQDLFLISKPLCATNICCQAELAAMKEENERLAQEVTSLRQQSVEEKLRAIDEHGEEYVRWHDKAVARVREEASQQMLAVRLKLEQAEKECAEVKQLYIEVCASKDELMEANRELEARLHKVKEKSLEAETLQHSLQTERERRKELELELQMHQEREKKKADEDAVRQCKPDPQEEVVARLQAQHEEHLEQVKQESVQCLANELSALEARHRQQLEQAEEEYARNLASFRSLIDNKTQEVEVLKKAMLKERDKLRAERENLQAEELRACKEGMDVLEERLQSCEKEWQAKLAAQADEWRARLASYQRDVEAERDKMAQALAGWAEELQSLQKQYQESESKVAEMHNKYRAAKKTARQYKLWADGKEKHLEQEWRRICVAFQNALEALHAKAETALAHPEGDVTIVKQLDAQIQELQSRVSECAPRNIRGGGRLNHLPIIDNGLLCFVLRNEISLLTKRFSDNNTLKTPYLDKKPLEKQNSSPVITLIGTDNNQTILSLTDAERLKNVKKWLAKSYEVKVLINGDANNMTSAEEVYDRIIVGLGPEGRIVQKRLKGSGIRFQILPPKKTEQQS